MRFGLGGECCRKGFQGYGARIVKEGPELIKVRLGMGCYYQASCGVLVVVTTMSVVAIYNAPITAVARHLYFLCR